MRSHPRPIRPAGAFTLLELAIVIAVIAIVGLIAAPRYASSMSVYRASFAARKVAADLAMARNSARASSASRTVEFRPNAGTYGIAGVAALNGGHGVYTVSLGEPPFSAALSADFGEGKAEVTFDGYGTPSSGGTVTVTSGGVKRTVTVNAQDGACTVQ